MKVTVAMVFCDNTKSWKTMLASINRFICSKFETEIILVDNRRDKSLKLEAPDNCQYVVNNTNLLNAWYSCLKYATGDLLWIVDDDDKIISTIDFNSITKDTQVAIYDDNSEAILRPFEGFCIQPFRRILTRDSINKIVNFIEKNLMGIPEWYEAEIYGNDLIFYYIYAICASSLPKMSINWPCYYFSKGRTCVQFGSEEKLLYKWTNAEKYLPIIRTLSKYTTTVTENAWSSMIKSQALNDFKLRKAPFEKLSKQDLDYLGITLES